MTARTFPENAAALWRKLLAAGLVEGEMPPGTSAETHEERLSPWFVKVMLGIGAWLSAILFIGFVEAALGGVFEMTWVRALLGLTGCVAAAAWFADGRRRGVFPDQLAFVAALTGQALVLSAIVTAFPDHKEWRWLAVAFFELIVLFAIRYAPNRFLSALAAVASLYAASRYSHAAPLFVPACLAVLVWAEMRQWRAPECLPMVVLALAVIPAWLVVMVFVDDLFAQRQIEAPLPLWVYRALMSAAWFGVVFALLRRMALAPLAKESVKWWFLAALLAACGWTVPLGLFALAVLLLGFSQRSVLLQGIGIVQLLLVMGQYYYTLQATLLLKSLSMIGLGAGLLLAYGIGRYVWRREATAAAVERRS